MVVCFIYVSAYLVAAWKWGDWRNWKEYYPTILFFIIGDLLYQFLFFDYSMWEFHPISENSDILNRHTLIDLLLISTKFPATVLIFLYHFPQNNILSTILYLLFWDCLYGINEWISYSLGMISHHHGWNFVWSLLFNFVMFAILRIHHTRPLLALILSFIFAIFLWEAHQVPTDILK